MTRVYGRISSAAPARPAALDAAPRRPANGTGRKRGGEDAMTVGFVVGWVVVVLVFAAIYRDLFRTPAYIPLFALNSVPLAIAYLCVLNTSAVPLHAFLTTYVAFLV